MRQARSQARRQSLYADGIDWHVPHREVAGLGVDEQRGLRVERAQ
jgi:hypothetical protein